METFGLRRTQSLKSLSGSWERSWVMQPLTVRDRKSVSQLVQHYQSYAGLRSYEKADQKLEVSGSCVDGQWRRPDGQSLSLWESGRSSNLSRSRSMDFLPQRETCGTRALCALFESKATLPHSPQLNSSSTARDCPLQDQRSHNILPKDTANQRSTQVEGGKAMNELPESYNRAFKHAHDDKYYPSLTKGGTSTRQARDRISTSSSVRDRSALYLSRAAAIDSTGDSTQPEFIGTPRTRAKTSKFQSPAKEMCSACLMPVYPMEKMVANKLILHFNCFCCKHCQKKLSIHNYSSLYGEFYCISHYQQLFKRKGNYDEGFGHTQHKDRWLQKHKGIDEPDSNSTPKITKNKLNNPDGSRVSPGDVPATKSSARELGYKDGADVKGKLKMSWPPQKKNTGVNPAKQTYASPLKNNISDIGKTDTVITNFSERRKNDSRSYKGEINDKGIKEQSRTAGFISTEKLPSGKPNPVSDPTKTGQFQVTTSPIAIKFSSPASEKSISVTNQTVQMIVARTPKTNHNPTSNSLNPQPVKVRKSVRFASNVDVAQYDQSYQLSLAAKNEIHSGQPKLGVVNKSREVTDISDNTNVDHLKSEFSKEPKESETYPEIHEYKRQQETTNTPPKEHDVTVQSNQEITQADSTTLNVVEKTNESLDTQSHTETLTLDIITQQEQDVLPSDPVSPCKSENTSPPKSPEEQVTGEKASLERNENQCDKTDSTNDQVKTDNQKKPVERTNSLKGSANQAEKTKTKLGSWSKGKSPLSKLFTSGGTDKTNKAEPKDAKKPDVKPSGGLLGRLFQSSSEKAEDIMNSSTRDQRNDKTHAEDKTTEKVQEAVMKKEGDMSEVPPLEKQVVGNVIQDESQSSEPNTLDINHTCTEPVSETGDDLTAPSQMDKNPTNTQESKVQSSEVIGLSVSESTGLPSTVQSMNTVHEESIKELIPEKSNDPFNDDIFGDSVSPAPVGPVVIQMNPDKSSQKPKDLLDAPEEGGNLSTGALFDLNHGQPQDPSNGSGPSDTLINTFPTSLTDTTFATAASAETFTLTDSQPMSAEDDGVLGETGKLVPDSAPVNQDETTHPFGGDNQTNEQHTDFDIFSLNDNLFTQPPTVAASGQGGADSSTGQSFPDDIFGVSDVSNTEDLFTVVPSRPATSNSLDDLLGSDVTFTAAPSVQTDLFADDIFASESQLLPLSEPSGVNVFADSLPVSENSNTGQKTESWMEDLLG